MKICQKESTLTYKVGKLYKRTEGLYKDTVFLAAQNNLINVEDGMSWTNANPPWGSCGPEGWEDVTNRYCLQEI